MTKIVCIIVCASSCAGFVGCDSTEKFSQSPWELDYRSCRYIDESRVDQEFARLEKRSEAVAYAVRLAQLTACPNGLMLNVIIRSENMHSARREFELYHRQIAKNGDDLDAALRETFGAAIPEWVSFRPIAIAISPAQGASKRAFAEWSSTASLIRELRPVEPSSGCVAFLGAIPLEIELGPQHFEDVHAWLSEQNDVLTDIYTAASSHPLEFRFKTSLGTGESASLGADFEAVPVRVCSGSNKEIAGSESP